MEISDNKSEPFRLLDLPKDIRLMIYEHLPYTENRHNVPLQDRNHHITLVNWSVSGIRILGTCRLINEEASYILKPRMNQVLRWPPRIFVEAKHLVGLIALRDGFKYPYDILDKLFQAADMDIYVEVIQRYRQGRYSNEALRTKLGMRNIVDKGDRDTMRAVASFMLRVAKWVSTKPFNLGLSHPPLLVVIELPSTFRSGPITTTTSRTKALYYRLVNGIHRRSRVQTGTARLNWLVRRFSFDAALKGKFWSTLSIMILLQYTKDGTGSMIEVPRATEDGIRAATIIGVQDADLVGCGFLGYGGVAYER
ncbi:uncharacterized protein K460DRAFT_329076 [Cucurbitaria berberidis CBS 394.84]|uniref:F-box domain-containing protein n=1 Tax=Cucurbitaria berberidis CBS 394.84 TaxID=1168544 RepID=A0A9P4GTW5_9PLEO|nr:uncharacterized protein K460DRAFT_329076 [Cucurbitaria berberidis CBS 394.84]KAF1851247.1 hypothetical protein K460DRAFT_329076 [Cucurbitaria berberidis CBS 394.84]